MNELQYEQTAVDKAEEAAEKTYVNACRFFGLDDRKE